MTINISVSRLHTGPSDVLQMELLLPPTLSPRLGTPARLCLEPVLPPRRRPGVLSGSFLLTCPVNPRVQNHLPNPSSLHIYCRQPWPALDSNPTVKRLLSPQVLALRFPPTPPHAASSSPTRQASCLLEILH